VLLDRIDAMAAISMECLAPRIYLEGASKDWIAEFPPDSLT